jgi:hypothetical protein
MAWYRDRKEGTSADGRALAAGVDERLAAAADEEDILEVVKRREALEAGRGRGRRRARRGRPGQAVLRRRRGVHPAPGRVDVAAPAPAQDRLRARRANHRPAPPGRRARPPDGSKPRDVMVGIEELHRLGGPDRD